MARKRRRPDGAASGGAEPVRESNGAWIGLGILLAGALAAKAAALVQIGAHPLLQPEGEIDGGVYARLAARILSGDPLLRGEGPVPYFVSPLYAYFLAACRASWPAARIVQILLGTAAVALVFLAARRLFGGRAALFAGALYALVGVVTFHEVVILQAALDPFLTASFLYLLAVGVTSGGISSKVTGGETRAGASPRWGIWVGVGVAGGLLALNRPNALLCVAAIAAVLLLFALKDVSLRTLLPALALLVGAGLAIAPFTLRNLLVSREFVLISSHGGLNFLVGNGPGADGVYRPLPGITPDIGGQSRDSRTVAEAAMGRSLKTREVSAYFAGEAWKWIRENPASAARLFLRKVHILLSRDEAPLNFSYPWYEARSATLRLLAFGTGLLVPLAGAGFVIALLASRAPARRSLLVWSAFVPAYVVAVAIFFAATRYRLPLLVALAPLAGAAIAGAPAAWRAGRRGALAAAAAAAAVLAAVSLSPTGLYDGGAWEDMHWALYLIEKGDFDEARRVVEATEAQHPDRAMMWYRVGRSWLAAKRPEEAIAALEKGVALVPHPPETEPALAEAYESRGVARVLAREVAAALPDLERAVALLPDDPVKLQNLATALAESGDRERARALARRSLELRPGYEKAEFLLRAIK